MRRTSTHPLLVAFVAFSPILALGPCLTLGSSGSARAQSAFLPTRPTRNPHNTYGSPLDTLKSSHLWTSVAPARDFVRESRPDTTKLDYAPLTGTDPERPKPRDKANIEALQAELEQAGAMNSKRAQVFGGATKSQAHKHKKPS